MASWLYSLKRTFAIVTFALRIGDGGIRDHLLSKVTAFSPLGNGQSYHMVGYQVKEAH